MDLQFSLLAVVGIGLGTMFFGYFFGLFEGRNQGYKRRKKEEASEVKALPPVSPPAASPQVVVKDDPGLLRLKSENNQLRLEVDGQRVDVPLQATQRKRLIDLLTLIRPFLEGTAQSPAPQAATPFQSRPVPSTPPPTLTPAEQRAVFGSQAQPKVEPVPARISLGLGRKKEEEKPVAPLTMVEQIDAILQAKIANTPLAAFGLKIQEGPGGLVNVIVGDKKFEGVGDVPDPNIQAVLRAAVAEWEKKFTPGL
jgi:hypothetical protein